MFPLRVGGSKLNEDKLIKSLEDLGIDRVKNLVEKEEGLYELELENGNGYKLKTFPMELFSDLSKQVKIFDALLNRGVEIAPKFNMGKVEDENQFFILSKKAMKVSKKDFDLGVKLGSFLREYHRFSEGGDPNLWEKRFGHRMVLFFHNYYLCNYTGPKDYILLDYLKDNKHLISDRDTVEFLGIDNLLDISLDDEGRLGNLKFLVEDRTDPYYQFKDLNLSKSKDWEYSRGLVQGYFNGKPPILFFKTLAVYSIVEYLYDDLEKQKSVDCESLRKKIDYLLELYEDFSKIYPRWYKN